MAVDLARAALARAGDPERVCLVDGDRSWRFSELDGAVGERAEALRDDRVGNGAIRAVLAEPTAETLLEILGWWRLGETVAPLNPRLSVPELEAARAALASVTSREQAVLWTSGTSGRPRGVELTHAGLVASADAARARLDLGPDDVWLASLSLAHVGGLALVTRALHLGNRLTMSGAFDAAEVSDLIDGAAGRTAVTHLSLVPTQLLRLLDHRADTAPPPTFRLALIGGAHLPLPLLERALAAGWPLALTYGMTEMTSQVATASPALVARKPGTVGAPLDGVELRIGPGGEILARGATMAARYIGSEGGGHGQRGGNGKDAPRLVGADGWYATGDLGHLDEEGHLFVTGRRSDRIVTGGVTVDALEVEAVVRGHPAVIDVCVAGVPDEQWGEVVGALVVGVEGELDLEELDRWVRERLSDAKRPRRWVLGSEIPLNANGKANRAAVRESLSHG